jgi:hypothetical protein
LCLLQRRHPLLEIFAPVLYDGVKACLVQFIEATLGFAFGVFAIFACVPVFGGYVIVGGARLQAFHDG